MRIGWLLLAACSIGCQAMPRASDGARPDDAAWAGVYAATDDRDGSTSLLSLRWVVLPGEVEARPIYHLYARLGQAGQIDVVGAARIDGDRLTLAIASAMLDDEGDSHAVATVERYLYRRAGTRAALIREDAVGKTDASSDGVLIKIADDPASLDEETSTDAVTIARRGAVR